MRNSTNALWLYDLCKLPSASIPNNPMETQNKNSQFLPNHWRKVELSVLCVFVPVLVYPAVVFLHSEL